MKRIITHSGVFHADDVFSVALVQIINPETKFGIIRTRDKMVIDEGLINSDDWVLDIGCVSDPEMKNFDHHQNCLIDSTIYQMVDTLDLRPIAKKLDLMYLRKHLRSKIEFISNFDINKQNLHCKLSGFDKQLGYRIPTISTIVYGFNRDPENDAIQYQQFILCVNFAKEILLNFIIEIRDNFESINTFDNKIVFDTTKRKAAIMDKYCSNWKELIKSTHIKYIIIPDPQGYAALTFDHERFPINVDKNHEGLIFLHDSKFIAKFNTKESAIDAIKQL